MAMDTGIKADTSTFNFSSKEVSFDETSRHVGAINIIRGGGRMNARRFAPPQSSTFTPKVYHPPDQEEDRAARRCKMGRGLIKFL